MTIHTHILGICGTFMGGLAVLASELGHRVSGSDTQVYPPMSTQLKNMNIEIQEGYEASQLDLFGSRASIYVVGNVMRRGFPVIEALLNQGLSYLSGPEWLAQYVLKDKHVLAVSGTHGKTTTTSMLAWILEYAGLAPGFLIGGVANNFGISARLGKGKYFVVEADEYDSAFFDKRSKFVHYRPKTLIINNIEFDHADIFPTLEAIKTQFHHLVRTVPGEGLIIAPENDENVKEVLKKGCWTPIEYLQESSVRCTQAENCLIYSKENTLLGEISWDLLGQHNRMNALAAIKAAEHIGITPTLSIEALSHFKGVKRRLEKKGEYQGITVYDDFAHHPTAIQTTLLGLRNKIGHNEKIIAVLDIRSNTMRAGHHQESLAASVKDADEVYFFKSQDITWGVEQVFKQAQKPGGVFSDHALLSKAIVQKRASGDHVVFMSNGGFGGIQEKILQELQYT